MEASVGLTPHITNVVQGSEDRRMETDVRFTRNSCNYTKANLKKLTWESLTNYIFNQGADA